MSKVKVAKERCGSTVVGVTIETATERVTYCRHCMGSGTRRTETRMKIRCPYCEGFGCQPTDATQEAKYEWQKADANWYNNERRAAG